MTTLFFPKATEQIEETQNLHEGVGKDVMNASHKVDEVLYDTSLTTPLGVDCK